MKPKRGARKSEPHRFDGLPADAPDVLGTPRVGPPPFPFAGHERSPKTPAEACSFVAALLRELQRAEAGQLDPARERSAVDAATSAWRELHASGVRDVKTRRAKRATDLLEAAHRERMKYRIAAADMAADIVKGEHQSTSTRGDSLADIPAERWALALRRRELGYRGRGKPPKGDERLSRDETLARLLEGESVADRAGTPRSKTLRDSRRRAASRRRN